MRISKLATASLSVAFSLMASTAHADVVLPALYVADSQFRFWYVVVVGLTLEAGVLRWRLIPSITKAFLVSFVVNAFSATVGTYLLAFGMLGWHIIVDNFVRGTFDPFNKVATICLMLSGSAFLEMWMARMIWKYPMKQTLPAFTIGNILSYGVIVADLYFFGGWNRSF